MKSFMNTPDEFHAFVIGLCEVLCPWPPRNQLPIRNSQLTIAEEYHYYLFGRAMGVIAWLIIAKIIQEAFW